MKTMLLLHCKQVLIFSLILMNLCFVKIGFSQDILLDAPVRAGELTLFPSVRDANRYYYLPDKPRLAQKNGKPEFSFLRYVNNVSSDGAEDRAEGEGGGLVHAVVELNVTDAQLTEAKSILRRINSSGQIVGPCIYEGGTIALISSIANEENGFAQKVLGLGNAPILDGQKAAVSILLNKEGARILWQSFQTSTPDMAFSFQMELKGYRAPIGAVIEVNFDEIYKNESFSSGAVSRQGKVMLGAEINMEFEELKKTGAIKVTSFDPDADIEKATAEAYSKLTAMMFNKAGNNIGSPRNPASIAGKQSSMLDRAQKLLSEGRKDAIEDFIITERLEAENETQDDTKVVINNTNKSEKKAIEGHHRSPTTPNKKKGYTIPAKFRPRPAPSPTIPTTAAVVSYSLRKVRQTGKFRIDLNKYKTDVLTMRFDQNVGDIRCSDCFREFNYDSDNFYKQREIAVIMDGYNASDFEKFINFVSVSFKKTHESGEITTDEIRIDRNRFNNQGNFYKFLYGWKGDNKRTNWLDYEYKIVWSFFGGATYESEWIKSDINTIPLTPPYLRKVIDVEFDATIAQNEGVRSAEVMVTYEVEGKEMKKQVLLRPSAQIATEQVEILEPAPFLDIEPKYNYEVEWILRGGITKKSTVKTGSNLVIYADEI